MPRFFVPDPAPGNYILDGENGRHAVKSLRMRPGEMLVLCDGKGLDFPGVFVEARGDSALVCLEAPVKNICESPLRRHLYQCLPKSDKLELIVQKSVELGVFAIHPVISAHCVATMGDKAEKKLSRLSKIALEAAKQSGRGIIPQIHPPISFEAAVKEPLGAKIFLYEGGGEPLSTILSPLPKEISLFVGPEGGFSTPELKLAKDHGAAVASLGPRILRTETAPLCALSAILHEELRQQ